MGDARKAKKAPKEPPKRKHDPYDMITAADINRMVNGGIPSKKEAKKWGVRFAGFAGEIEDTKTKLDRIAPLVKRRHKDPEELDEIEEKRLLHLLSMLTSLTKRALEVTLIAEDGDYKDLESFRYELATMCVDRAQLEQEKLSISASNERMINLSWAKAEELKELDPLIELVFVGRYVYERKSNNKRGISATSLRCDPYSREYGLGVSGAIYGLYMTQALKRGVRTQIVHMGGPNLTNTDIKFIDTGGMDMMKLVRECILRLDSTPTSPGIFKKIRHLCKFEYIDPDEAIAADLDIVQQRRFRLIIERGGVSHANQWDWGLTCARSNYAPEELLFPDGAREVLDSAARRHVDSNPNFLEYSLFFEKTQAEFLTCTDRRRWFRNSPSVEVKAMRFLDLAERYRLLAESLDEFLENVDQEWSSSHMFHARLVRHMQVYQCHAWYYAAGCGMIAGDYHTAFLCYKHADTAFRREYGNLSRNYLVFLMERTYMLLHSIVYLPEAYMTLREILFLVDEDMPDDNTFMMTDKRKKQKHDYNIYARPLLRAMIDRFNESTPLYKQVADNDDAAFDEWYSNDVLVDDQ